MMIQLEDEEQALLSEITFDVTNIRDPETSAANGEKIATLTKKLLERRAIPEHRCRVFADKDYATGGKPPPYQQYKNKGRTDEEMYRNGNFAKHLHYFIYGPKLSQDLIDSFSDKIEELKEYGDITSGDYEPIVTHARQLARHFGLKKSEADEMFKLAFEYNLDLYLAEGIRKATRDTVKR